MQPTVEGASPEQKQLLLEILSGLGATALSRIVLRPHEPRYEDDTVPRLPEPHGDAVVLDFAPDRRRADWEATLLAFAFARRSSAAGLPKVAWCEWPDRGFTLELAKPSIAPLSRDGRCDGIYIELCDTEPAPVLQLGWHRKGGFSGSRRDVECCAPFLGLSRPIGAPPPPACPVFG